MVNIEPVTRTSLVDEVVTRIRQVIDEGQLNAGDRLPSELELVEKLGVSRPVLREAIGRLEALGLLNVVRGRGMFVGNQASLVSCSRLVRTAMSIAPKDMRRLAEFRAAIEIQAARLAAANATSDQIAELETLCDGMDRPGTDYAKAVKVDFEFHYKIAAFSGNALLENALRVVQEFILAGMVQTTPNPRNTRNSQRLHRRIFDAIQAHDPDAAEAAMKVHMDAVMEALDRGPQEDSR